MKVYLSAAVLLLGSAFCTSVQASLFDNGEEYYKNILLQRHNDENNRQQNSKSSKSISTKTSKSTSTKTSKSSSSVCHTLRKRQCKYSHYSDYCSWDSPNRKCEPTTTYADEFAGVMEPDLLTSCDGMRRRKCTDTGACNWDYKERTCVRRRRPNNIRHDPICLNQDDFNQGTMIIKRPGVYKLCQDIVFDPNAPPQGGLPSESAFDPEFGSDFDDYYAENEYGLGFFAALVIVADDVTLDLNGHTIEQSAGHALMQRFFAVIELASSPFISAKGPAQFVSNNGAAFKAANNVKILGPGVIGRSSHHGIHGNNNSNVTITGVTFRDFEVAAVAMNRINTLEIRDNFVSNNRHDVPVVGMFSAARFLRPYGKYLKYMGYSVKDENGNIWKTAEQAYDDLIESINNVFDDVINGNGVIDKVAHPEEHHLYDNPHRVVDGPCYAFVVHGLGPSIGGQGEKFNETHSNVTSSNINIQDNIINGLKCFNNEVPALFNSEKEGAHGAVMNDPRGSVFQTIKTFNSANPYLSIDEDGKYKSNVVADMQLIVAQAILDGTLKNETSRQTKPNSITQSLVDWARNGETLQPEYVCNGDSMHHVVKGTIVIRVEDSKGFNITGNVIANVENLSTKGYTDCKQYHVGSSKENENKTQAGNVRAISAAADRGYDDGRQSVIHYNYIGAMSSTNPEVIIGLDIQGDSKALKISENKVDLKDRDSVFLETAGITHSHRKLEGSTAQSHRKALRSDVRDTVDDTANHETVQSALQNLFGGFNVATPGSKHIALRIREEASSINVVNNNFIQPVQFFDSSRRRLRGRKPPHPHVSGEEWNYGGCPYFQEYAEVEAPKLKIKK